MANYDKSDVSVVWFVNQYNKPTTINVKSGTMTRKQAGELLDIISTVKKQPVGSCGYTCDDGGHVRWH